MAQGGTGSKYPLTDLLAFTAVGQASRFPSMSSLRAIAAALMTFFTSNKALGPYKSMLLGAMFLFSKNHESPYIQVSFSICM